ncbi:MAG TPA: hypothetical protein VFW66_01005 [Gemmatimonadales bacterium]|nr:hypothetical protein [Gemmatimonadales bacterium]
MSVLGLSRGRALAFLVLGGALAAGGLTACGGDAAGPTPEVAGTYHATRFTVSSGGTETDLLAKGGSLVLELTQDGSAVAGTVRGTLVLPAEAGGPATIDMAGRFSIAATTVRFFQDADTFVRSVDWTLAGSDLKTSLTAGEETLLVVLTRD